MKNRVIIGLAILWLISILMPLYSQVQELRYNVRVEAKIIPIYAVDDKGNPVYDLRSEEIKLLVNGTAHQRIYFSGYRHEGDQLLQAPGNGHWQSVPRTPQRIIFIIIDSISNSTGGVRNAKRISRALINAGGSGDAFIIIEASPFTGLRHVVGPSKDKRKLLYSLGNLRLDPQWRSASSAIEPTKKELAHIVRTQGEEKIREIKMQYRKQMAQLAATFIQFKDALQVTNLAKTVYFVSGGVQEISDYKFRLSKGMKHSYSRMVGMMSDMVNKGGALFYAVNPAGDKARFKEIVTAVDRATNGHCISGVTIEDIVGKMRKNTAAYYQLAFSPAPGGGEQFRLDIQCSRPGVKLNFLRFDERRKPYYLFNREKKKLFALNVIYGGAWSRLAGDITTTDYQINSDKPIKGSRLVNLDILIPAEFKNRQVDIFAISMDAKTAKSDFQISSQLLTHQQTLNLNIKSKKGRKHYIVVIDPQHTNCLFAPVTKIKI